MMGLVREQSIFLLHVSELIRKASELGFVVTGGELYRTPEQQALYVKNGRSKTMSSQHLKRLAIDLNFFRETADGQLKLTYNVEDLRPVGDYWESLDPANRWGGNWNSFKDTPHFERRPEMAPKTSAPVDGVDRTAEGKVVTGISSTAFRARSTRGADIITRPVGPQCPNLRDDVESVQRLLNLYAAERGIELPDGALKPDGIFGSKTLTGIMAFQRNAFGELTPDGKIEPNSIALVRLCEVLPLEPDLTLLSLIYLRAAEKDIDELGGSVIQTMARYEIDTPLRQAHFLAQIGHESGELRFRAELASGEAYEGRLDLGNTEPGDGRRFKGRGLIQLTGRANYKEYGQTIGRERELLENPQLLETDPELCVDVAGWYWHRRNLNSLADADDLIMITKRINGGLNGLENRRRLLQRGKSLLVA